MPTYKERKENQRCFVLIKKSEKSDIKILGIFGNLRKLCKYMEDVHFPRYSTLVRNKSYPFVYKEYIIFHEKIN